MTILSKKQPGSANNPAQPPTDVSSTAPTSSSITLQPIQTINEPIPITASEEPSEPKNSGLKSPIQNIQSPVKIDSSEIPNTSQITVLTSGKVKSKKSNKRKIKSPNLPINNNFMNNISQSNLASILSSSSSSSSGSSVSSNESLPFNFNYQNDLDQTEYYRLSDDSDYELNDENSIFYNKNDRKKFSMKETNSKKNKISKLSSNVLGASNVKMKRNKNHEIKTKENNNSEDEYEQTPAILINSTHDETFIKSSKTIEELEQSFCRALKEKKGFIIKHMKEDGACLFRAVADQIYGDQEMHSTIRSHCMDYIAKNGDYFKQYMTEDIDRYLNRKRQDNCFGNHIEIIAISEIYNRPIEVYEYSIEPKNIFQSEFQTDNEPIRLSYHGRMHYNSVVNPYKATIGVGLGLPQLIPGLAEKNLLNEALKKSEEFHIEQTMLDDKLKATDWEATNEELMELVARESYLQWLKDNEKRENVNFLQATTAASCSSWSVNESTNSLSKEKSKSSPSSKSSPASSKTSSKISSAASSTVNKDFEDIDLFALTNQTVSRNSLQDDDDILARVLAESQQEYLDSLKFKHQQQQHSH